LYLQGTGNPKLIPEEITKMMKELQNLGIQKIDGNLFF
jgi:D-alanyl-D-alanine carboxypeptidase/D-alanyl-D-alanine-endopeptidase (penicillin-binding protein 4)